MNKIVDIAGGPRAIAPLDATAYYTMLETGTLPCDGRVELIDGMLVEISPSNSSHGRALFALSVATGKMLPKTVEGNADVAFVLSENLVLAPDIAIVPKGVTDKDATGEDLLLVIEIADNSLSHDLKTKAPHYAAQGARDLWIVDLANRKLHIHRSPGTGGYADVTVKEWDEAVTALLLPSITLTLSEVLAP